MKFAIYALLTWPNLKLLLWEEFGSEGWNPLPLGAWDSSPYRDHWGDKLFPPEVLPALVDGHSALVGARSGENCTGRSPEPGDCLHRNASLHHTPVRMQCNAITSQWEFVQFSYLIFVTTATTGGGVLFSSRRTFLNTVLGRDTRF